MLGPAADLASSVGDGRSSGMGQVTPGSRWPCGREPNYMRARRHRRSEISFDEQFYPARPRSFRRRQARPQATAADIQRLGPARAENPKYVDWVRRRSMLRSARATARHYSGTRAMWRNPFSAPRPRAAVQAASVVHRYPLSLIIRPDESYLRTLSDATL